MSIRARSVRYLSATVVAAAVSFVMLPLTTKVLGPASYGIFALGSTLAGVGASVATLGMTVVLANRWVGATRDERQRLVGTLLTIASAITIVWALVVGVGYLVLRHRVAFLGTISPGEMGLALGGLLLSPAWTVAADVATVEGAAAFFARSTIAQSLTAAAATLIALFAFDLGTVSLFAGVFVGAAAGCVYGLWYLRDYVAPCYDARIRRELAQSTFALAQILETVQSLAERVLLSRYVGYATLGLFVHSRRYRDFANLATTSVTRGVWPVTLDEAKDLDGSFPATTRTWRMVHVWLTAGALAATALGDRFISLLTHGKFTPAWTYLAPWFVLLLIQLSAKPEVGAMYAFGRTRTMGRIGVVSNVVGIAVTLALIPWLGAGGALVALVLQALCFRIAVRIPSRRLRTIPFQDWWAVAGCATILAVYVAKRITGLELSREIPLLIVAEAAWLGLAALFARDVFALLPARRSAQSAPLVDLDVPPDDVEL